MKTYSWSADFVRKRLPGAQGWVYVNWARENEASVWGSNLTRRTPGYVKQEVQRLLDHG